MQYSYSRIIEVVLLRGGITVERIAEVIARKKGHAEPAAAIEVMADTVRFPVANRIEAGHDR